MNFLAIFKNLFLTGRFDPRVIASRAGTGAAQDGDPAQGCSYG